MASLLAAPPFRAGLSAAAAFVAVQAVPWQVCAVDSHRFDTPGGPADALAAGVAENLRQGVGTEDFGTGNEHFDQEWVFGTSFMAAMGFGQLALTRPRERERWAAEMERAIAPLLDRPGLAFEASRYHLSLSSPPATLAHILADDEGHAAWLGYTNLALSLHRAVDPDSPYIPLNDRIVATLAGTVPRARTGLLETFPGERYPVDNAAGLASVGLYDQLTGADHAALRERWGAALQRHRGAAGSPAAGLLTQYVGADGRGGPARGSGTLLASWFLAWGEPALSRSLYDAAAAQLYGELSGYGLMREYPPGQDGGGDIDSGPIIAGFGVSATGFGIGAASAWDRAGRRPHLYATAHLFGAPVDADGVRHYATGGPLGDAILFAMLTTPARDPQGRPLDAEGRPVELAGPFARSAGGAP